MVDTLSVDLDLLLATYEGKDISQATLLQTITHHNQHIKEQLGSGYTLSTYQKYEITKMKVASFIYDVYRKKDIKLRDVERRFIREFDHYLKTVDKNEHNTSTKYCKNLKRIFNVGVADGWIEKSPFEHFPTPYKSVEELYLTREEPNLLQDKTFKLQRLNLVKDLFVFQCYTGLAFALAVIDKYNPLYKEPHKQLLPVYSNQKFNS
jgi:hypothetical protein